MYSKNHTEWTEDGVIKVRMSKMTLTANNAKDFRKLFKKRHQLRKEYATGNPVVQIHNQFTELYASNARNIVVKKIGEVDAQILVSMKCFRFVFVDLKEPVHDEEGLLFYLSKLAELNRLIVTKLEFCPSILRVSHRVQSDLTIRDSTILDNFRISLFRYKNLQKLTLDKVKLRNSRSKRILFDKLHFCSELRIFLVVSSNNNGIETGHVFDCNFSNSCKHQMDNHFIKLLQFFGIPYLPKARAKVKTAKPLVDQPKCSFLIPLLTKYRKQIFFRRIPDHPNIARYFSEL